MLEDIRRRFLAGDITEAQAKAELVTMQQGQAFQGGVSYAGINPDVVINNWKLERAYTEPQGSGLGAFPGTTTTETGSRITPAEPEPEPKPEPKVDKSEYETLDSLWDAYWNNQGDFPGNTLYQEAIKLMPTWETSAQDFAEWKTQQQQTEAQKKRDDAIAEILEEYEKTGNIENAKASISGYNIIPGDRAWNDLYIIGLVDYPGIAPPVVDGDDKDKDKAPTIPGPDTTSWVERNLEDLYKEFNLGVNYPSMQPRTREQLLRDQQLELSRTEEGRRGLFGEALRGAPGFGFMTDVGQDLAFNQFMPVDLGYQIDAINRLMGIESNLFTSGHDVAGLIPEALPGSGYIEPALFPTDKTTFGIPNAEGVIEELFPSVGINFADYVGGSPRIPTPSGILGTLGQWAGDLFPGAGEDPEAFTERQASGIRFPGESRPPGQGGLPGTEVGRGAARRYLAGNEDLVTDAFNWATGQNTTPFLRDAMQKVLNERFSAFRAQDPVTPYIVDLARAGLLG